MSALSVSIIILTYNHESFILEALQSVALQEYPGVQLVIGDDASSDRTCDVIDQFEQQSAMNIDKIYFDANVGITRNFNACLERCQGDVIFVLGGDDVFCPGKIAAQVQHLEDNPNVTISYHDVEVFDSDSNRVMYLYNDMHGKHEGGAAELVRRGAFGCGCSVAIRNKKLPACDERIKFASDWLWYIEVLMLSGGEIKYLEGVYARYRRHANNITGGSHLRQQYAEVMQTLDIVAEKYPSLKAVASKSVSERNIAFSMKFFIAGEYRRGLSLFKKAMSTNSLAPLFFLRIRIRRILRLFQ